jgi:hypothetical protein
LSDDGIDTRDALLALHHRMYGAVNQKLGKATPPLHDVLASHANSATDVPPFLVAATVGAAPQHDLRTVAGAAGVTNNAINTLRQKAPPQAKASIDAILQSVSRGDCCTPPPHGGAAHAQNGDVVTFDATTVNIMMGLSIAVPLIIGIVAAIALALVVQRGGGGGGGGAEYFGKERIRKPNAFITHSAQSGLNSNRLKRRAR